MTSRTYKRLTTAGKVSWSYEVVTGRDGTGRRIRHTKHGYNTRRDAGDAAAKFIEETRAAEAAAKAFPHAAAGETLRSVLDRWLDQHAARNCSPKTTERYRQLLTYISDAPAKTPIRELNTLMLETEFMRLRESGGKDGSPLSAKTVRNTAGAVHAALGKAIRWGLIDRNPADHCELPKMERREARALDANETERLLAFALGTWLHPVLMVAAATGCRRGEMLALRWDDADLEQRALSITKSLEQTKNGLRIKPPKNGRPRMCPLPVSAVEALKAHRASQEENRRQFGDDYLTDLNLIFAAPDGNYLKPDSVTASACLLARKAGLPGAGLHSLRHSHGSQLLSAGVPLPTVSKRLGHADPAITARVYSHSFSRDEQAAADIWDTVMSKAGKSAEKVQ